MALLKKETEEWELVSDDYLDIEDYSEESLHDKEKPPKKPKKKSTKTKQKKTAASWKPSDGCVLYRH